MRWLAIAALLVLAPAAAAAGPWLHVGPTAFPPITAVAAQGNSLFASRPERRHLARRRTVRPGCGDRGARGPAPASWSRRPERSTSRRPTRTSCRGRPTARGRSTAAAARACRAGTAFVVATANQRVGVIRANRLALSSNGCRTWTRPTDAPATSAVSPRNGTTWWVVVERPNLARAERFRLLASTDLGRTWRVRATRTAMKLAAAPQPHRTASLIADRVTANRLWLVHDNRLARSNDGGRTWTNVDAARRCASRAVAPSTTRPNMRRQRARPHAARGRRPCGRRPTPGASWSDTSRRPSAASPPATS